MLFHHLLTVFHRFQSFLTFVNLTLLSFLWLFLNRQHHLLSHVLLSVGSSTPSFDIACHESGSRLHSVLNVHILVCDVFQHFLLNLGSLRRLRKDRFLLLNLLLLVRLSDWEEHFVSDFNINRQLVFFLVRSVHNSMNVLLFFLPDLLLKYAFDVVLKVLVLVVNNVL